MLQNPDRASTRFSDEANPAITYKPEPPFSFRYSFTLTACKEKMSYQVSLANAFDSEDLATGVLDEYQTKQDASGLVEDQKMWDKVCIATSDTLFGQGGKRCFDKVTLYKVGLNSTFFE